MSLESKINEDIKASMLAKDKAKLDAIRAIKSAILLAKTEKGGGGELAEAEEMKILQKLVKQRKETAEVYKSQNRQDLADVELSQSSIIEKYLPAQLSEAEICEVIKKCIAETGASSIKDMGKVIGAASKQLAGKADNSTIAAIVKSILGV